MKSETTSLLTAEEIAMGYSVRPHSSGRYATVNGRMQWVRHWRACLWAPWNGFMANVYGEPFETKAECVAYIEARGGAGDVGAIADQSAHRENFYAGCA